MSKNLWTAHYVFSVLTTICCFGPMSVIGLLHLLGAQTEYRLGHTASALSKKKHAKAWSIMAWVFGLLLAAALAYNYLGIHITSFSISHGSSESDEPTAMALKSGHSLYAPELQDEINKEQKAATAKPYAPELQFEINNEGKHTPQTEDNDSLYAAELESEIKRERARQQTTKPVYAPQHKYEII